MRRWLSAIGSLTAAVNSGQGLGALLDLVAGTAQELLDLDFCGVMVPAADGENLEIAGSSGLPVQYIARVNTSRRIRLEANLEKGAPASRAFLTGRPWAVSDVEAEPRSTWTDLAREQGYRAILAVPLLTGVGVVGTLNSYRSTVHHFPPQEVGQLELLAQHAAIALTSARIVDSLREQNRLIVRSEEIHDRLLDVAVRSGGVSGIAAALHELLGGSILIRDANGETLASREDASVLARFPFGPAPLPPRAQGQRGLVREEGPDVVVSVLLDGSTVGTIWLLDRAGKLDALGLRAAEHASVVLSLELLRQRTAAEVEQTLRGELLADLLAGADPASPPIGERASVMGHDLSACHRLLVAEAHARPDGPAVARRGTPDARGKERAAASAAAEAVRLTSHLRPRPLIAHVRGVVVALWPDGTGGPAGEELLRRVITPARAESTGTVAVARLGDGGIPAAYRAARGALAFAADSGRADGVLLLDDLGAAGLLLQFAEPAELRRYAERTLGAVARYDASHGAELLGTLRAYLDCDLDRGATAGRLTLHPNTVSQRLRRIETLSGLNLRSPRSAMDARTALMLVDVADAAHGTVRQARAPEGHGELAGPA